MSMHTFAEIPCLLGQDKRHTAIETCLHVVPDLPAAHFTYCDHTQGAHAAPLAPHKYLSVNNFRYNVLASAACLPCLHLDNKGRDDGGTLPISYDKAIASQSGIQSAWLGWEHGCKIELNWIECMQILFNDTARYIYRYCRSFMHVMFQTHLKLGIKQLLPTGLRGCNQPFRPKI